jgi:SAM-dependent methyltransferase
LRKPLWRFFHYVLSGYDPDRSTVFLNYGYADLCGGSPDLVLAPEEEKDRNSIQLYNQVTRGVSLENARVLEVSSGRGGGAAFLARRHKPAEYIGVEIASSTVAFCNRRHRVPGLSFIAGNAERIPFPTASFDVVVNIESARVYPDVGLFFREAARVLKQGGRFLFADVFKGSQADQARLLLAQTGFETLHETDIRENVILALRQDSPAKKALIDARVPDFLRQGFYEISGVVGSNRFEAFINGDFDYWNFSLRKPGHP